MFFRHKNTDGWNEIDTVWWWRTLAKQLFKKHIQITGMFTGSTGDVRMFSREETNSKNEMD